MSALVGAARLAALDARGIALFDPSPTAAWRDVTRLVPLLLLAGTLSDLMALPDGVDNVAYLLLSATVSAAQMTGYLLAVSLILEGTGRIAQFPLFVSTYLWCSLISTGVGLLATVGVIDAPLDVANIVGLLLVVWSLAYSWFSVRAALACPGAVAAGLVVLEILTALAANPLPSQLIQAAARG